MTDRPTPEDLADWRRLAEEAAPGEWNYDSTQDVVLSDSSCDGDVIAECRADRDGAFIAAARTAVPRLIDEVDRLRGELAACEASNDSWVALAEVDEHGAYKAWKDGKAAASVAVERDSLIAEVERLRAMRDMFATANANNLAENATLTASLTACERERDEARAESERRRQDRADALNVKSRDGLLSSEWIMRTGIAERERDTARAELATVKADVEALREIAFGLEAERDEAKATACRMTVDRVLAERDTVEQIAAWLDDWEPDYYADNDDNAEMTTDAVLMLLAVRFRADAWRKP